MMRSVRRQRRTVSLNKIHGRQKLNNETIAFFRGRLGRLRFDPKDVRPCDGYGAATTERRRPPGKPQRW